MHSCSFMISLDKCDWSCNAVDELSTKICVWCEAKDVIVKVLNVITIINEIKTFGKHISCDYNCKFNKKSCNSNRK